MIKSKRQRPKVTVRTRELKNDRVSMKVDFDLPVSKKIIRKK